eukprot:GEMP01147087.1.p1 GENE.GEMP01147087.1~~GEMP01147087.1.p1  ORF type:complete len:104 (+),score=5.83 GEMP01147087.1:105-416(+)
MAKSPAVRPPNPTTRSANCQHPIKATDAEMQKHAVQKLSQAILRSGVVNYKRNLDGPEFYGDLSWCDRNSPSHTTWGRKLQKLLDLCFTEISRRERNLPSRAT